MEHWFSSNPAPNLAVSHLVQVVSRPWYSVRFPWQFLTGTGVKALLETQTAAG